MKSPKNWKKVFTFSAPFRINLSATKVRHLSSIKQSKKNLINLLKNKFPTYILGSEFKSHTRRFLAHHKIRQYSTNVGLFPKVIARMYFHLEIPFNHVTHVSHLIFNEALTLPLFLPYLLYTLLSTSDRLVWLRLASKILREYFFNAWSSLAHCDILL